MRKIIVLSAYLDASGQKSDQVVVVAGFVGWPNLWDKFEQSWDAFLKEFELDHFHATEFWARQSRPYSSWNDAKHFLAKGKICEILSSVGAIGIGAVIDVSAFKEWRKNLQYYYPSDPYYFCLDSVLYQLIYRMRQGPIDDGITVFCDQEKEHEQLGKDIGRWHEARLANNLSLSTFPLGRPRPVSILYGPKRKYLALQLADIFANDLFRKIRNYLRTGVMNDPYFTTCMKQKYPQNITAYFFKTPRDLEVERSLRVPRQ